MMIPEAWENDELMDEERRAFFQYHSALMEPWDGPAAVAFTDGKQIGATLDRNGLRPARYSVTKDGRVFMASEDGALRLEPEEIVERGRLKPGRMLVVDTERNEVLRDEQVKNELAARQPYGDWVKEGEIHLDELPAAEPDGNRPEFRPTLRAATGLRLHDGRPAGTDDPDGAGRQRTHGLDGHRHPTRRPLREAAALVQLLQAALRPGDQSTDRPAARRDGHVAQDEPGDRNRTSLERRRSIANEFS